MAKRTLGELQDYVIGRLGYATGQFSALDGRVRVWLNEAIEDLYLQSEEAPWTIDQDTLSLTGASVTLASAALKLEKNALFTLDGSEKSKITMVPRSKGLFFRRERGTSRAPLARPRHLWVEGFNSSANAWRIEVDPEPDKTYTLDYSYYQRPTPLVNAADVVTGPQELEALAAEYATWQLMRDQYGPDNPESVEARTEYFRRQNRFLHMFRLGDYEGVHFAPPPEIYDWNDSTRFGVRGGTSNPLDL